MDKSQMKQLVKGIETLNLTDAERAKLDGQFISLPSGITHYQVNDAFVSKKNTKTVVLVHGYATPYYLYDKVYESLTNEGYAVLRYDLLGRGYSERVRRDYTPELFAAQLKELVDALLPEKSFYLVGTSMGGTICATFSAMYPERVQKLVLLAPAGMDTFEPPFYMKLSAIKGVGDLMFNTIGGKILLKKCASELIFSPEESDYYFNSFAKAARYKGFVRSTLSSLRNTILKTEKDTGYYIKMAENKIPTLVIWGTLDKTMPIEKQLPRMQQVLPHAKFVTFEGSGHIFLYDEGERTMNEVLPFFAK